MKPADALDYPRLPPATVVLWIRSGHPWPSADRRLAYLTGRKRDPVRGYALFTTEAEVAETFANRADALRWLAGEARKRGTDYYGIRVSTVGELVAECFPSVGVAP